MQKKHQLNEPIASYLIKPVQRITIYEVCRDKTCLRSFGPGPTQTRLHRHRRMANGLKFRIKEEEALYYLAIENKVADQLRSNQLRSYCAADLRLCFPIFKNQVYDVAHIDYYCQKKWLYFCIDKIGYFSLSVF